MKQRFNPMYNTASSRSSTMLLRTNRGKQQQQQQHPVATTAAATAATTHGRTGTGSWLVSWLGAGAAGSNVWRQWIVRMIILITMLVSVTTMVRKEWSSSSLSSSSLLSSQRNQPPDGILDRQRAMSHSPGTTTTTTTTRVESNHGGVVWVGRSNLTRHRETVRTEPSDGETNPTLSSPSHDHHAAVDSRSTTTKTTTKTTIIINASVASSLPIVIRLLYPRWTCSLPNLHHQDNRTTPFTTTTVTLPQVPSFMIIGTHKGGTTALYHLLRLHPSLLACRRPEAHFFDQWMTSLPLLLPPPLPSSSSSSSWQATGATDHDTIQAWSQCHHRRNYAALFNFPRKRQQLLLQQQQQQLQQQQPPPSPSSPTAVRIWTFEKTPSYLFFSHIPALVQWIQPHTKLIVSLRDPVQRFRSGHAVTDHHHHHQNTTTKNSSSSSHHEKESSWTSLEQTIEQQVWHMREVLHLTRAPTLSEYLGRLTNTSTTTSNSSSSQQQQPPPPHDSFDFSIPPSVQADWKRRNQIDSDPNNGLYRGLYAQQLRNWLRIFPRQQMHVIDFDDWQARPLAVLQGILTFVGVPTSSTVTIWNETVLSRNYSPRRKKHTAKAAQLVHPQTVEYLQHFYRPYNQELGDLLGGEWKGKWQY